MTIVRCKGIQNKKNPKQVILKIIEGERKGKIAFPTDFVPSLNQIYICEIVKEKPNYCFVKLHKCHFIEEKTQPSIYISSSYVDIVFELIRKCICGNKEIRPISKTIRREEEEELEEFLERAKVEVIKFLSSFSFDNKTILECIRKIEEYKNRIELEVKGDYIYIFNENEYRNLNKLAGEIIRKYNLVFPYITLIKKEGNYEEPKYIFRINEKEVEIQEEWEDSCGAYQKYSTNDIETAKEVLTILYGVFKGEEEYCKPNWKIETAEDDIKELANKKFEDLWDWEKLARIAFKVWYNSFKKFKKVQWYYYRIVINDNVEIRIKTPFEIAKEDIEIESWTSYEVEDPLWKTRDYEGCWVRYEPKTLELILEKTENADLKESLDFLMELAKKELELGRFVYRVVLKH